MLRRTRQGRLPNADESPAGSAIRVAVGAERLHVRSADIGILAAQRRRRRALESRPGLCYAPAMRFHASDMRPPRARLAGPLALALVCLCALPPRLALGVDKQRALTTMKAEAGRAYEEGQYARASELFWTAWQLDKAQTGLLYNAARTAQIAGQLERAEELYRLFLSLPERDAAAEARCRGHLEEIADTRADSRAELARRAAAAGDHRRSAALYREAAALSPRRARYQEAAAAEDTALADGNRAAAPNAAGGVQPAPAATEPPPQAQTAPGAHAAPGLPAVRHDVEPALQGPGWLAGGLLGVGAVAAVGALLLQRDAAARADALQGELALLDSDGFIVGVTYADATRRDEAIGRDRSVAVAGLGLAAAFVGAGAWLWWRRGDAPAGGTALRMEPRQRGLALAVDF